MMSIAGLCRSIGIRTWTPVVLGCWVGTRARSRLRATTAGDRTRSPGSPVSPLAVNCNIQCEVKLKKKNPRVLDWSKTCLVRTQIILNSRRIESSFVLQ